MSYFASLRVRIILTFLVYGLLLGGVLIGGIYFSVHVSEEQSQIKRLRTEVEFYLRSHADFHSAPVANSYNMPFHQSPFMTSYVGIDSLPKWAKGEIALLTPGEYQRRHDHQKYHIAVRRLSDGQKFFLFYNVTRIDTKTSEIRTLRMTLVLTTMVIIAVGLLLGLITAHRSISPLITLTRTLKQSGTDKRLPENFASCFPNNEIGFLAGTLEQLIGKLHYIVMREKHFSRDAAHELRAPIATLKSSLELLREPDINIEKQLPRILGRMERASLNMENLIRSFLWLSHQEDSDNHGLTPNPRRIVDDVVEEHEFLIDKKPLRIQVIEEAHVEIPVAPDVLRVLLANLLRNALSYTQMGTVTIFLQEDRIRICDTGVGIRPEILDNIRQVDAHYHAEGFGFGLAIVKRICNFLGWCFVIDSVTGIGTDVTIGFATGQNGCIEKCPGRIVHLCRTHRREQASMELPV